MNLNAAKMIEKKNYYWFTLGKTPVQFYLDPHLHSYKTLD
jgi:hypothetical protein